MRKIDKAPEPISLTDFKSNYPNLKYSDLRFEHGQVRIDIRSASLKEQFHLCGYCCNKIDEDNSHNEHLIPQSSGAGSNITLDFDNIIVSCESHIHCGHKKGDRLINSHH
jgi:uncharacterized protein (TIGR02646 family)